VKWHAIMGFVYDSWCNIIISCSLQAAALLHATIIMRPRLSKHTRFEVGSRGYDISAAGAPLEAIVAHALTSYQGREAHSNDAVRTACKLLNTSKTFQQAVSGCEGAVAVNFSPATTEAAAAFAGGHCSDPASTGVFLLLPDHAQALVRPSVTNSQVEIL
jgi:hypothetical protein